MGLYNSVSMLLMLFCILSRRSNEKKENSSRRRVQKFNSAGNDVLLQARGLWSDHYTYTPRPMRICDKSLRMYI